MEWPFYRVSERGSFIGQKACKRLDILRLHSCSEAP